MEEPAHYQPKFCRSMVSSVKVHTPVIFTEVWRWSVTSQEMGRHFNCAQVWRESDGLAGWLIHQAAEFMPVGAMR